VEFEKGFPKLGQPSFPGELKNFEKLGGSFISTGAKHIRGAAAEPRLLFDALKKIRNLIQQHVNLPN